MRGYYERERINRPDIDDRRIIDVSQLLIAFCTGEESESEGNVTFRSHCDEISIGVSNRELRNSGIAVPSLLRITMGDNPFSASSGVEIRLPHDDSREQAGPTLDFDPDMSTNGIFASYPFDGIGWRGHRLANTSGNTLTVYQSVRELDMVLEKGRPESSDEWVGFYLADLVLEIQQQAQTA